MQWGWVREGSVAWGGSGGGTALPRALPVRQSCCCVRALQGQGWGLPRDSSCPLLVLQRLARFLAAAQAVTAKAVFGHGVFLHCCPGYGWRQTRKKKKKQQKTKTTFSYDNHFSFLRATLLPGPAAPGLALSLGSPPPPSTSGTALPPSPYCMGGTGFPVPTAVHDTRDHHRTAQEVLFNSKQPRQIKQLHYQGHNSTGIFSFHIFFY